MFHVNDRQLVVNLDYEFSQERTSFMITKTLFIRCYTIKCDLSLNSVQHNIMHYIIAWQTIYFPKVALNEQTNIILHF